MATLKGGKLGNKRLAAVFLGYPDWAVDTAETTITTASTPFTYEVIRDSAFGQNSTITMRAMVDSDEFSTALETAKTTNINVIEVSTTIDSYEAAIGGYVEFGGEAIEGASISIMRELDGEDIIENYVFSDANGRFDAVVPGGPVYHVAIHYEDSNGQKYNAPSKPYIDTSDP